MRLPMKVSLYIRQRGTRQFQKHNRKKSYPQNSSIIWVLRYGSTWETLDVKTLSEAASLRRDARSNSTAAGVRRPKSRSRPS
jgi:hypothetical protein